MAMGTREIRPVLPAVQVAWAYHPELSKGERTKLLLSELSPDDSAVEEDTFHRCVVDQPAVGAMAEIRERLPVGFAEHRAARHRLAVPPFQNVRSLLCDSP